ncbi:hypothetical protein Xbed_01034 [Xenorhabdus beddingii]|uniref:Uncharacterized protein n=1 Tax=Xenorhabdus beddingii TaxID=40578 RepID=A0A1Y2SR73_9GAMM|nr:hypothetical protein Xbed_01034 [Xenorhabdus beddingii]
MTDPQHRFRKIISDIPKDMSLKGEYDAISQP